MAKPEAPQIFFAKSEPTHHQDIEDPLEHVNERTSNAPVDRSKRSDLRSWRICRRADKNDHNAFVNAGLMLTSKYTGSHQESGIAIPQPLDHRHLLVRGDFAACSPLESILPKLSGNRSFGHIQAIYPGPATMSHTSLRTDLKILLVVAVCCGKQFSSYRDPGAWCYSPMWHSCADPLP
jgi:hypothetical protein